MEQPTKKIYKKRNSPTTTNKTESHQWYMHNVPEYKINKLILCSFILYINIDNFILIVNYISCILGIFDCKIVI